MEQLNGKVAVITGASKGIGRATALRLARDGVTLVAGATGWERLEALKSEAAGMGAAIHVQRCDVTCLADCEDLVESAVKRFGGVDILINNAGIGYSGPVVDSSPEEAETMVRVNVLGVYHMARSVLPVMIDRQKGDIVNIASVAGLKYSPNFALYSATKFAVRAFSEGLRNEVQAHNIRVATVNPGMVATHFFDSFSAGGMSLPTDKGELLKPEDIAEAIYFALTRPRSVALNEVTVRPYWQER
ncbi:MAG: SDR family oxidoreductase [Desulfobacterales bacterium]